MGSDPTPYTEKELTVLNGWFKLEGYIYMGSSGHLKFVGVQRRPTHIQEYFQAILELKCSNP